MEEPDRRERNDQLVDRHFNEVVEENRQERKIAVGSSNKALNATGAARPRVNAKPFDNHPAVVAAI